MFADWSYAKMLLLDLVCPLSGMALTLGPSTQNESNNMFTISFLSLRNIRETRKYEGQLTYLGLAPNDVPTAEW